MKVRIKFSKWGAMKFVGHLDTMRYFQKAVRRAALPASFTGGFSPHMKMSFACPLGVGMTSEGEYFDLELDQEMDPGEITARLHAQMTEGFAVLDCAQVPEGKSSNAMSLVAAADYLVWFREGKAPCPDWTEQFPLFLAQEEILITKTGKNGQPRQVDIKPFLYEISLRDTEIPEGAEQGCPALFMRLASASANYTRPDQVIDAFYRFVKVPEPFCSVMIHRLDTYAASETGEPCSFISLHKLGMPDLKEMP